MAPAVKYGPNSGSFGSGRREGAHRGPVGLVHPRTSAATSSASSRPVWLHGADVRPGVGANVVIGSAVATGGGSAPGRAEAATGAAPAANAKPARTSTARPTPGPPLSPHPLRPSSSCVARYRISAARGPGGRGCWSCWMSGRARPVLLRLHARAGRLEGVLGLVGVVLGSLLQDRRGGAVDQLLGLLETEVGEGAHLLMTLIFFSPAAVRITSNSSCSSSAAAAPPPPAGGGGNGGGSSGGHAELLLNAVRSLPEARGRTGWRWNRGSLLG